LKDLIHSFFSSPYRYWIIASLIFTLFSIPVSIAQTPYPNKPISFIVPYGTSGSADLRSRQVTQKMSVVLKQSFIVENKPGAGGNIGTEFIARANPDGYTIGMGNFAPLSVNKYLFEVLRFDPEKDVVPIILIEKGPLVLVVNTNSPFKTIDDTSEQQKQSLALSLSPLVGLAVLINFLLSFLNKVLRLT
jgi:tripartite-type tricarboxylate transporter receptor subunit TctC